MTTETTPAGQKWAREYETIYILRPNVSGEVAQKVADRVQEVMAKENGKLTLVDDWGKRKLAYGISGHSRGFFLYLKYLGYSDLVAELERNFRQFDDVLRFQTILLRDMVDPSTVEVNEDDIAFTSIEQDGSDDEDAQSVASRLGLETPTAEGEDLKSVFGVDRKIEEFLHAQGVMTWGKLAAFTGQQLNDMLMHSGIEGYDADTWPEQARLAAEGDWDRLKSWQAEMAAAKGDKE